LHHVQAWKRIAHAVSADSASKNHVIYDVLNEPEQNFTWVSQPANSKHGYIPSMADIYFSVFDAIHNINPGKSSTAEINSFPKPFESPFFLL
jgi:hypothetical protein